VSVRLPAVCEGHWRSGPGHMMAEEYVRLRREDLAKADMPDFELANAIFLADRNDLDLIHWQTAAKERIRWLSAQLAALAEKQHDPLHRYRSLSPSPFHHPLFRNASGSIDRVPGHGGVHGVCDWGAGMTGVPASPSRSRAAHEAASASSPEASIPNAVRDLVAVLTAVSTNALYRETGFGTPYSVAKALGFIEECEVEKPCRSCGRPQTDYRYSKVTVAGQAYLNLASAIEAPSGVETGNTDSTEGESATRQGDAQ
jgi:hypothetical protein